MRKCLRPSLARSQCNWINQLDPLGNEIINSLNMPGLAFMLHQTSWLSDASHMDNLSHTALCEAAWHCLKKGVKLRRIRKILVCICSQEVFGGSYNSPASSEMQVCFQLSTQHFNYLTSAGTLSSPVRRTVHQFIVPYDKQLRTKDAELILLQTSQHT